LIDPALDCPLADAFVTCNDGQACADRPREDTLGSIVSLRRYQSIHSIAASARGDRDRPRAFARNAARNSAFAALRVLPFIAAAVAETGLTLTIAPEKSS
jgi:hypothetical protein